MVPALFFLREETSDHIVVRVIGGKHLHNDWSWLAPRHPQMSLVKYT